MVQSHPTLYELGKRVPDLLRARGQELWVKNVGREERWISGIGGSALSLLGLWKRGGWGIALALLGGGYILRGISGRSILYRALGISTVQRGPLERAERQRERMFRVERSVTVNRSPQDLYRHWRALERLPEIIPAVEEVLVQSRLRSRWTAQTRGPFALSWEAEIIGEEPDEYLSWHTLPGSTFRHQGTVRFLPAPGGRGTEVKVTLEYNLPGGKLTTWLATLCGLVPDQQAREALRHFKALMETGEVPTVQKQPHFQYPLRGSIFRLHQNA